MAHERTLQLIRPAALGICSLDDSQIWDGDNDADKAYAKTRCGHCPIQTTCLANALEEEGSAPATVRAGVRGGLDGGERAKLYDRRSRKRNKAQEVPA